MVNLTQKLEDRKAELRGLAQQKAALAERETVLRVEVDLLEQLVAEDSEQQRPAAGDKTTTHEPNLATKKTAKGRAITTGKRLSGRWKALLEEAVRAFPKVIDYDDVDRIHAMRGYKQVKRDNVRSHVWASVNAGLYRRVGPGKFRATEKACVVVGIPLGGTKPNSNNEAPGPSEPSAPSHNGDGSGVLSSSGSGEAHTSLAALPGAIPADPRQ